MRIRFVNRGGKLYCKVIDQRPGLCGFSAAVREQIEGILAENGALYTSMTSAGGGHCTYRFSFKRQEDAL